MGLARNGAALVALLVAYVCFVDAVPMEYFSYGEIVARMKALEAEFPEFVEVRISCHSCLPPSHMIVDALLAAA